VKVTTAVRLASSLALLIALTPAAIPLAQSTDSQRRVAPPIDVAALAADVSQLKAEILQLRLEMEHIRLDTLERELRGVTETLRWLTSEEQSLQQEVEDLQRQLLDPALSSEQHSEIATTASEASTNGAGWLSEQRTATEERESALRALISQSQHTRSELLARARELGLTPAGPIPRE
jgi:vacuolar-type H+-ATPase subunit H